MNGRFARSIGALALALNAALAMADGDGRARSAPAPLLPQYRDECSSCHIAFPPRFLPAASWRRIIGDLAHHYGANASLDPATAGLLSQWLAANAGTGSRSRESPPDDRITRSTWFLHEHDEMSSRAAAQRRAADCAACHPRADQGDFHERSIRIPR